MDDELKKRDRARDAKKKAAKTKFKEMGRKWDQNEKLVRTHYQSKVTRI